MIKQIDHLAIVVTDLEKSMTFFETLGFEEAICSTPRVKLALMLKILGFFYGQPGARCAKHVRRVKSIGVSCWCAALHPRPKKSGSAACTQRLRVPRRECRACLP